jgi:hypothetical protein
MNKLTILRLVLSLAISAGIFISLPGVHRGEFDRAFAERQDTLHPKPK